MWITVIVSGKQRLRFSGTRRRLGHPISLVRPKDSPQRSEKRNLLAEPELGAGGVAVAVGVQTGVTVVVVVDVVEDVVVVTDVFDDAVVIVVVFDDVVVTVVVIVIVVVVVEVFGCVDMLAEIIVRIKLKHRSSPFTVFFRYRYSLPSS
ncbi:unnamed protein product [Gongylonema pulchrum]|uniref:Uncharacterized protein n=1 Tax=Gongylonema pulchrum TaxID=637853 RepID=A0A183DTW0_9BILA|nr:unnamed protein product [Gongylonema pulchrum]